MRAPSLLFTSLISTITVPAQEPLPLYEPAGDFAFHLAVDSAIDPMLFARFDTLTVIDSRGAHVSLLDSLWWTHIAECCHDSSRWFAIGRYALKQPIDLEGRAYILGAVDGSLIQLKEDRTVRMIEQQRTSAPQQVRIPNSPRSWWWRRDSLDQRTWWLVRREDHDHGPHDDREYRVPLDSCTAWGTDSITQMRCPARPGEYIGTADMLFLFAHDTLITAHHDVRKTGLDGYGPFFYRAQGLLARYTDNGSTYLMFQSGDALRYDARGWMPVARRAVRYYGECDCPEE